MVRRLTDSEKKYLEGLYKKGVGPTAAANRLRMSVRHVKRLWARIKKTGTIHAARPVGRPTKEITTKMRDKVLAVHDNRQTGVLRTTRILRADGFNISYQAVYKILGAAGRIERSSAKSKKRKWVRFERKHSNAMWHVDWHTMKDPRLKGLNLVVYLDDASRCITGFGLFQEATSSNAVLVLTQAMHRFGTPATILSDNGRCFVGAGKKRKKEGWKPTVFQECLLDNNIELINTRPYHPQTNGKIERLFRTIEEELYNYKSMEEYVEYYNNERLHFSLDIEHFEVPRSAFATKTATAEIRENNPKWMEIESNE